MSSYDFASFVDDVEWRVRMLAARVEEPDVSWPGLLILDVVSGLAAEAFPIGATVEELGELLAALVDRIRIRRARRFACVMPCLRRGEDADVECLLVVCG